MHTQISDAHTAPQPSDFSAALRNLKNGQCLARRGWHGKGMFVFLMDAQNICPEAARLPGRPVDAEIYRGAPHLMLHAPGGDLVPWIPSQTDLLAEDWTPVDPGQADGR
ncbi:hypothetical protein CKO28_03220 [Rhodovibrio sodomensis]|uniref:Thoeris anti-defense 2-like domain-containing protein n=1 Tax=Rhodovibrio sodomensis TaxID=1088 RepID=A0ABS1DCD5_9PROT|nr:DUF2829 domain-containing protein [Rhodovibrio sodomensis]MBK1667055.1 hypothetical protein [Rhodovibrio sodomensis]